MVDIVIHHVIKLDHESFGVLTRFSSDIEKFLLTVPTLKRFIAMSAELDARIADLTTSTGQMSDAVASAENLMTGLKTALDDAIAAAQAAGATPEELQSLSDLSSTLSNKASELANAVIANTPAAPGGGGNDTVVGGGGEDTTTG